jgi:hypothetical protein
VLSGIVFTAVSFGLAIFMANRMYVLFKYGEINVRGAVYSREKTPTRYWLQVVFIAIGFLFGAMLSLTGLVMLLSGRP